MPALFINTPETMARVRVISVKDHAPQALRMLQSLGVLHPETSHELRPLDRAALEAGRAEVRELLGLVEGILSYAPAKEVVALGDDVEVLYTKPYSEIRDEIRSVHSRTSLLYERVVALSGQAEQLRATVEVLTPVAQKLRVRLADLSFSGECIASRVAVLPAEAVAGLRGRLGDRILESVVSAVQSDAVLYIIVRAGNLAALESSVEDAGGRMVEIPGGEESLDEFLSATAGRIGALDQEAASLRIELQAKAREDIKRLVLLREALAAESGRLDVLAKAAEANYVSLIEGWVPERDVPNVVAGLRESSPQAFADARKPESGESPPTKLKNARLFRPFEQIVNIVDIPKYGGWDPTPIVAYSFAFFYGLMLSDVIYGLGLLLAARFLLPKFVEDPYEEGFKQFQRLIYMCSGVVMLFGLLNGSWMGNIYTLVGLKDVALSPLVARLMGDPLSFVIMAVIIGFIHVNAAHILALVKGIADRNTGLVLNRVGLLLTQVGLPGLLSSMLNVRVPLIPVAAYPYLTYAMYAGIVVVIVSNVLMNKGTGFFLWIFDITGLFGDVVSYARLAGVGLATFYLGQSFNLIIVLFGQIFPGIVGAIVGTLAGAVLFVIGHTFNLILGGMGCFVHSLRLCFVEFLTKFYDGGGQEYEPFRIRKRAVVPVALKSS
jgi:V/A-type H+-transporting ATPase subunit I